MPSRPPCAVLAAPWFGSCKACWSACCLFLLWQPALSIATLRPQQNIVAVVIDDSKSMATGEDGHSRKDQVLATLNGGLLNSLKSKFQVRLYRLGDHLERIESLDKLNASAPATHIGEGLKEVLADSATLPIGAVVLMSDGADNSGGIDLDTISDIKRQRIPIHTVGFGRERMAHDIEVTDVQIAVAFARKIATGGPGHVPSVGTEGRESASGSARFRKDFDRRATLF